MIVTWPAADANRNVFCPSQRKAITVRSPTLR